jgi:hypothetical protein
MMNNYDNFVMMNNCDDFVMMNNYDDFFFFSDVNDIDLFPGGLSEKPLSGGVVGPTFACLLAMQFHNIKFADRFWYEAPDGPGAFTNGKALVPLKPLYCAQGS